MGTRSVTHFKESSTADPFMTLYRQYDGNPQNHGLDMVRFMQGKELVNGFGIDDTHNFNGMGDLAAQMVAHFKTYNYPLHDVNGVMLPNMMKSPRYTEPRVGGYYIMAPGAEDVGEQYSYHIYPHDEEIFITIFDEYEEDVIYEGSVTDYSYWPEVDGNAVEIT
ncbi:uncharacterized protein METZ01_LOCUS380082 [marine metagenome]|jgi:hypothetical protein|uniref:Uncharacterized protein n=1 Tax=marine metagenome TaxID=408172 RepID=A0A382U0P0_9ZZZZ